MPLFKSNRDLDTTLLMIGLIGLFFTCMVGLFLHDVFFTHDGAPRLLTEALVHTILGFVGGWISSLVTFFFTKQKDTQTTGEDKQP